MPDIVAPGDRLGERYRLERPLGAGGMATVWRAVDLVLDRAVAVKVPMEGRPAEFTRRLREEAQAAASLTHPNITGVYDYGEHDPGPVGWQGHIPYVVMELLDGETLATRLSRGPLPWREAAGTCARVADALAAAHAAGIVHRDIKPANVFLTPVGVKVLDFGIAFTGSPDGRGVVGTPAYVAPELLTGTPPTPAADIYSLGVVLHECLTGAPPTPVSAFRKDTPDEIADLCRACLAPDAEARPTAAQAARRLARAAGIQLARSSSGGADEAADRKEPPRSEAPTRVLTAPAPQEELPDEPGDTDPAGKAPEPEPPAPPAPGAGERGAAGSSSRGPLLIAGGAVGAAAVVALLLTALAPGSSDGEGGAPPPAAPSPTRTAEAEIACSVAYRVDGTWPGGFQASVRITNAGEAAIDGWELGFAFPDGQAITQIWNGSRAQDGASVRVTAADWNRSIPPGGTAEFGFLGSQDGANGSPSRFTLNGTACRG